MKRTISLIQLVTIWLLTCLSSNLVAGEAKELPVRAFKVGSPSPGKFNDFIKFIDEELSKTDVNQLFLRINYNYQFTSHPELSEKNALSKQQIKEILNVTRKHNIELIPLVNLLGHQSWKQDNIRSLLVKYPQFEENPGPKLLEKDFYTRAYCPNHPEVHNVIFAIVDEIVEVFESKGFHAGMDEVFVLGEDGCPRCKGKNKAELFANEVNLIQRHLAKTNTQMYIWGDRLLDGNITGIGKWAASQNDTAPAIDMISKDIIICDWQYKYAPPTPGYFAVKGFNVISAAYQVPEVAKFQLNNMIESRKVTRDVIKNRLQGVMHTYWGNADSFYPCYTKGDCPSDVKKSSIETFKTMFPKH